MPADVAAINLREIGWSASPDSVFRLLVGLIDGAEHWTYDQSGLAALWLCRAAGQYADAAIYDRVTALDSLVWAAEDENEQVRMAVSADVSAFVSGHADPAARAWLPTVRVAFDRAE